MGDRSNSPSGEKGPILEVGAEKFGAPVVYSEDLNHGHRYGPVRVLNPFPRGQLCIVKC